MNCVYSFVGLLYHVFNVFARASFAFFSCIFLLFIDKEPEAWYNIHVIEVAKGAWGNQMNPSYYIPIVIALIIIFIEQRRQRQTVIKQMIKQRKTGDRTNMVELAKWFIEKECLIYTFNGNQIEGTVKAVNDGALLLEKNGVTEVINLDFIVRIREYPRNKNGKKKSVILD